jgi:hypothetical protein
MTKQQNSLRLQNKEFSSKEWINQNGGRRVGKLCNKHNTGITYLLIKVGRKTVTDASLKSE